MSKVTLIINDENEFATQHPVITFGRTSDNDVALDDTNVSRYHARIEQREDGYWLIDQESSNGSSVNGNQVETEMLLENNDVILFGGSSRIRFTLPDEKKDDETAGDLAQISQTQTIEEEEKKKNSSLMYVAGGVVGLAVISVAVAGFVLFGGSSCEATVRLNGADSGEVLQQTTEITAEIGQAKPCVGKAVFVLNGEEVGTATAEPYTVTLDAGRFPDWNDGMARRLRVDLYDTSGNPVSQLTQVEGSEISLVFETAKTPDPEPQKDPNQKPTPNVPQIPQNNRVTVIETQRMILALLKKNFPNAPSYKLDQQFLIEVNKKLDEYVAEGYFLKAQQYRDLINVAYVQENDLDISLGYTLAMSRSKFDAGKQSDGEGLWRISNNLVSANGFNLAELLRNRDLNNPSQNCSVKISALYLKSIVKYLGNDIILSVASFGKTAQEVDAWKASLPPNEKNFWKILNPQQKDEVVRFFAAGVVTENPQKFGLKKDRPLSDLYRNLAGS